MTPIGDDAPSTPVPVPTRFAGRVALLTAAGSGIGAATARRLAAEGADVLVTDVDDDAGSAVTEHLVSGGGRAEYRHLDVTEPTRWREVVDELLGRTGRLDVLHLNAGRNIAEPIGSITDELWARQIDLSLTSALYGVRTCLPSLLVSRGNVVITSSIHAVAGLRGFPAYAAAKGGLSALVRQLAGEYGPDVRVNAVLPGAIETGLWDDSPASARDTVARLTPAGRMGTPEEVASAVAFLASDDAAYVTGVNLLVDGGRAIYLER